MPFAGKHQVPLLRKWRKDINPLELPDIYRYIGLLILLVPLFLVLPFSQIDDVFLGSSRLSSNDQYYPIIEPCNAGTFRSPSSQLPPFFWQPFSNDSMGLPVYWTHPLTEFSPNITTALIIQHGNLRNANNYFCSAIESIQQVLDELKRNNSESFSLDQSSYLIISPQFLTDGDLCWDTSSHSYQTIDSSKGIDCNYYLWTSEGWKDGKPPINNPHNSQKRGGKSVNHLNPDGSNQSLDLLLASPSPLLTAQNLHEKIPIRKEEFFSYDVFNLIIDGLANEKMFPNLEKIISFGFSAGGQTLLRYSLYPNYNQSSLMSVMEVEEMKKEQEEELRKQQQKAIPNSQQKKQTQRSKTQNKNHKNKRWIEIKTIVGDMSSYFYFDNRRPFNNGTKGFGVPNEQWITKWEVQ
jgi:hypothetical protein